MEVFLLLGSLWFGGWIAALKLIQQRYAQSKTAGLLLFVGIPIVLFWGFSFLPSG